MNQEKDMYQALKRVVDVSDSRLEIVDVVPTRGRAVDVTGWCSSCQTGWLPGDCMDSSCIAKNSGYKPNGVQLFWPEEIVLKF